MHTTQEHFKTKVYTKFRGEGGGVTKDIMTNREIENATVLCFCHKIISTLVGEDGVVEWLRSLELNS